MDVVTLSFLVLGAIGAESVSDGLEALLQAWKEVARAEVRTDA